MRGELGMQIERENRLKIIDDEPGFNYLKRMIRSSIGLDCAYYRDKYLKRRINLKMKEKGYTSYARYGRTIKGDPQEFDELIKFITVNYTKFYRDRDVYNQFKDFVIPNTFEKKKTVRILSAGCSSGEEPYTIAILLKEYLDKHPGRHLVSITAVDIDDKCLANARAGEYPHESVADLKNLYLKRYFEEEDGCYRISDEIKKMVRFKHQDLTRKLNQKYFDVILCRNVFIYFTNEAKAKIISNFYDALNTGGYLILGKTEMMPAEVRDGFKVIDNRTKLYQKITRTLDS